ncbi:MAG: AbrB/MazE/SpoVT family DNA-binding domain-containing protein [Methanocellales archaeon]|nr:AbrB/MazE/SpoVT family DNA-binding domain-containing protein [Methanocellales archaeon]
MEVETTKISPKGQVVIPSRIRRELGIQNGDRFLVFGKNNTVIFKKIEKAVIEKTFDEIVEPIRKRIKELRISREDVDRIIHEIRSEKR